MSELSGQATILTKTTKYAIAHDKELMAAILSQVQDLEKLATDAHFDVATIAALYPISLRQLERRFARLTGLPLRHIGPYPGTATSWQNHRLPHTTAFVVELPPGPLTKRRRERYGRAVIRLAR